jgi:hypothetical protein
VSAVSCPVLIVPACLVVPAAAGAAVNAGASDALSGIADAIQGGIAWIVSQTLTWWVQVPSPDLAAEPAVGQLQQWILPVSVAVAVLGMITAGAKMALTRKAAPLADIGSGLAVIAATSAIGVLLPTLLLRAGDAWSAWILQVSAGGQFASRLTSVLTLGGAAPGVIVVLGIIAIVVSALQAILMLFRQGALIVLAGVLPLAAAGMLNPATRAWFRRVTGWMLALIFYKPAAAAVYATAFTMIGSGRSTRTVLMGFAMVGMSLLALPVLMRFFNWTGQVAESAGGGGFLQTALSGAVAIGALRGSGGGAGGPGPAEQARTVSAQLGPQDSAPSGSQAPGAGARNAAAPAGGAPGMTEGAAAAGAGAGAGAAPGAAAAGDAGAAAAGGAAAGPAGAAASAMASGAAAAGRHAAGAMTPPDPE